MHLPTLISESQVRIFSFYWEGHVRSGMSRQGHLYALLDCYPETKRATAFEKGCELAEHHDIVLTVSEDKPAVYRLWIALQSQSEQQLLRNARCIVVNKSSQPA